MIVVVPTIPYLLWMDEVLHHVAPRVRGDCFGFATSGWRGLVPFDEPPLEPENGARGDGRGMGEGPWPFSFFKVLLLLMLLLLLLLLILIFFLVLDKYIYIYMYYIYIHVGRRRIYFSRPELRNSDFRRTVLVVNKGLPSRASRKARVL